VIDRALRHRAGLNGLFLVWCPAWCPGLPDCLIAGWPLVRTSLEKSAENTNRGSTAFLPQQDHAPAPQGFLWFLIFRHRVFVVSVSLEVGMSNGHTGLKYSSSGEDVSPTQARNNRIRPAYNPEIRPYRAVFWRFGGVEVSQKSVSSPRIPQRQWRWFLHCRYRQ
jgi:hypothetical protein